MPKVNLLYVITKLELGGAQKQLLSLIDNLDRQRYQPFLFTANEGLLFSQARSIPGLTIKKSKWLDRQINPLKDIFAIIEIYFFIKKNKIQIVHTHSSKAGILGRLAAKLAKAKIVIHTVHGWPFHDHQNGLLNAIYFGLERIMAFFTDRLIVVSEYDKRKGLDSRIGKESQYSIIHYGIVAEHFKGKKQNVKAELGIGSDEFVVGTIACFKPQKSLQDFIKFSGLVKQVLPNTKFILVGDGVLRKKIESLITALDLNKHVILTGWRRDIPEILSVLDVFVLTSLWEGLPISVLEAMAASLPVVATNTGGIAEVINDSELGFLVSCGDIGAMAEKVVYLLNQKRLLKEPVDEKRKVLLNDFRLENMLKSTQELYSGLAP